VLGSVSFVSFPNRQAKKRAEEGAFPAVNSTSKTGCCDPFGLGGTSYRTAVDPDDVLVHFLWKYSDGADSIHEPLVGNERRGMRAASDFSTDSLVLYEASIQGRRQTNHTLGSTGAGQVAPHDQPRYQPGTRAHQRSHRDRPRHSNGLREETRFEPAHG
jgi:hypothetical protein